MQLNWCFPITNPELKSNQNPRKNPSQKSSSASYTIYTSKKPTNTSDFQAVLFALNSPQQAVNDLVHLVLGDTRTKRHDTSIFHFHVFAPALEVAHSFARHLRPYPEGLCPCT
ncbi:hypothetical protein PG987_010918 [Apiospora arundinis]